MSRSKFALLSCIIAIGFMPAEVTAQRVASMDEAKCLAIIRFCDQHWQDAGFSSFDECYAQDYAPQCPPSSAPVDLTPGPVFGPTYPNQIYCTGRIDCP